MTATDVQVVTWEAVLDEMEQRVRLGERYLAGEQVTIDAFVHPPGLGPLPLHLRERALVVLGATKEIERRFELAMGDVAYRSQCLDRARSMAGVYADARPAPVYVDRAS